MAENQTIVMPQFIQDILDLAKSHDFSSGGPEEAAGDREKVISEMTPFERACYVFTGKAVSQAKEKAKQGMSDEDETIQFSLRRAELSRDIMWLSIRERLNGSCPDSIGIRSEWQVVERTKEEDDCDCHACQLRRKLSSVSGISVIKIGISGSPGARRGFPFDFFD